MKVTELRLAKLFSTKAEGASATNAQYTADVATTARGNITNFVLCSYNYILDGVNISKN